MTNKFLPEIDKVLDELFPDWTSFPIFNNVYKEDHPINQIIFIWEDGIPVNDNLYNSMTDKFYVFIEGRWSSVTMASVVRRSL